MDAGYRRGDGFEVKMVVFGSEFQTTGRLIIGFHTLRPLRFCYELVSA